MANEIKLTSFIYPGCIKVCNGSAKFVNGYLPVIARIYPDRTVVWKRKRITDKMREYVEGISKTPFMAISYTQNVNFFNE